ncbi:hypothetical protein ACFE04_027298 [Oxalis oulophora]
MSSSSSSSSCWNHPHHSDIPYLNNSYPYNSPATFMEYFEGLTYQHVNFIFDGASHLQDTVYPSMHTSFYKFGLPDSGNFSYYDHAHTFSVTDHEPRTDEYRSLNNSARITNDRPSTPAVNREWEPYDNTSTHENPVECPRRHQNGHDHQVAWQDHIDPDTMTYELILDGSTNNNKSKFPNAFDSSSVKELLELGEAVGTQNRGLSQELLSLLPVSKYKRGFFSRKKSKNER